jgi:hypothetical protein
MPKLTKAQLVQQEGRIVLAIDALKKGSFTGPTAAAKAYDVPYSTIYDRIQLSTIVFANIQHDATPGLRTAN